MKKTICVFLIMVFVLGQLMPVSASWREGESWSYRWEYDYSEHIREFERELERELTDMYYDMGFSSADFSVKINELSGGFIQMLSIQYKGMDDGYHRFDYRGGLYSRLDYSIRVYGEYSYIDFGSYYYGSLSMRLTGSYDKVESDYSGTLWVEEYDYGYGRKAYGVVRQTMENSGTAIGDVYMRTDASMNGDRWAETMEMDFDINWNLNLDIEYSPPLPWLPPESGEVSDMPRSEYIRSDYSGELKAEGSMDMRYTGDHAGPDESFDEVIDENIYGMEYLYVSAEQTDENTVSKPSPALGSGFTGLNAFISEVEGGVDILGDSIGVDTQAVYDPERGFYTEMYIDQLGLDTYESEEMGTSDFIMKPVASESTSSSDVDEFLSDKEGYYSDVFDPPFLPWWVLWIVIPAAAKVSIAGTGVFLHKRKKRKTKKYRPYPTSHDRQTPGPWDEKKPEYPRQLEMTSREIKFCPSCGGELRSGAMFCPSCGKSMEGRR